MVAISVCLITEITMIMQRTGKLRQTNILHYFLISSLVCYLSAFPNIQKIFRGKNITWRELAWQKWQCAVLAFQVVPVLRWAKRRLLWQIKVRGAVKSRWHRRLTLQALVHGGILLIIPLEPNKMVKVTLWLWKAQTEGAQFTPIYRWIYVTGHE